MKITSAKLLPVPYRKLCIALLLLVPAAANAMPLEGPFYYVRPALRVGSGELIDGLQTNGATTRSVTQGVSGTSRSSVDLANGTVKMFAQESVNSPVGLQTFGGFGERIDIRGGAGTTWDIEFAIEGSIFGELGFAAPDRDSATFRYNIGLVVHQAGVANATNFLGLANDPCFGQDPLNCNPAPSALANEFENTFYFPPVEEFPDVDSFYEEAFASVSASILLPSNAELFDVFTYTNVQLFSDTAGVGSGVTSYTIDFENTATYSQRLDSGVEAFSSSGVFLGLDTAPRVDPPTTVPTPATSLLLASGLVLVRLRAKRVQKLIG